MNQTHGGGSRWTADGTPGAVDWSAEDLVVVSNRQPFRHDYDDDGEVVVDRPAGGLTAGLSAAVSDSGGTWVAWGDGTADRDVVDENDCVSVPPEAGEGDGYTLRRVWLSDEQVEDYYEGFANQVLWPLCHSTLSLVRDDPDYWERYVEVNELFADAVVDHARPGGVVWLQDYHFGVAPRLVRERLPADTALAQFWHIPWPSWDVFRTCPHGEEVLRGLLGNDVLGFHVPRYCENFVDCVEEELPDARVDRERCHVVYDGQVTTIGSFPMGVPVDDIRERAATDQARAAAASFLEERGVAESNQIVFGVDRLDYTKGIPERLDALERLYEDQPDLRGEVTYVQLGTESRSNIPAYQDLQERVQRRVDEVNERFGTDDWTPVVYTTEYVPNETLYGLYRRADVAFVTPLRDGMNLVAQEYVAAQGDDDGVLVLSDQAGAFDYLGEYAVGVTPQDAADTAAGLADALRMAPPERRWRTRALQRRVAANDIDTWMRTAFGAIQAVERRTDPPMGSSPPGESGT